MQPEDAGAAVSPGFVQGAMYALLTDLSAELRFAPHAAPPDSLVLRMRSFERLRNPMAKPSLQASPLP